MLSKLKDMFLPAIDVESAEDASRIVRAGLLVIFVAFVCFGGWMALAPLSGAVIAQGEVKVDMNRKTVQHQEGGIVKEIRVRDGDKVAPGQVLIVLDDVRVDASFDLLRTQHDSERARNARLAAERDRLTSLVFPEDMIRRAAREPKVAEVFRREENLFHARRETLREQRRLIGMQIEQAREEADALRAQVAAEDRALVLQKSEVEANRKLMDRGFVGEVRVNTVQRAAEEYDARRNEHKAELAKTLQKTTELSLRQNTLENQFVQAAADELKDSTNKLFDLDERLRPSRDAALRQNIVAPIAGEVVDLKVTSVGSVIGPRDALLDIVPIDSKLIVEGRIRTEDVNNVHVGGDANVRLSAFKARTTPIVDGKVIYVSADSLIDRATNARFYTVRIDVPLQALKEAGDLKLQAGMPVELFIKTAERTALQYMLDPVTAFIQKSFREP